MNIDCKIHAFIVEPKLFQELTDDISTWEDIDTLYTVTETVDIPDELVKELAYEQQMQTGPHVYLKYVTDGFKISPLERIHHRIEVEHRAKYKSKLEQSGHSADEVKNLTSRFFVMVYPDCNITPVDRIEFNL